MYAAGPGGVPGPEARTAWPALSVVIPTHNRRAALERCLRALLECETTGLERVEIAVVNDGGRDGTPELVEAIALEAEPPVELRVITREQGGSGAARNTGIAASSAPLVLFTDDDCRPDTAWLLAYARAPWTPETGVMAGRIVSPDQSSRVARYCRRIGYNEFPTGEGPITFANTANCAYPRAVLTAVGGFDERLCGGGTDVDLSHRVAALGYALAYLPEAVVRHYHREDLPSLLRGYRLRGYREGLRRALWSERKRPGPGRLALSAGSLLLRVLRATLLPVDAARMAADGVAWRDALPFAGYDWMRKLARGWGDLQFQLAGLCGREELTPRSAVTAGPPTSTSPADDGRAPLPGKP